MKKLFISVVLSVIFTSSVYAETTLNNSVNDISQEEKSNITVLLSACANIMRFDRDNYDFDTLMKYVLCTHENFAAVAGLNPETGISNSDPDGISIVNGDYIDRIILNIFKLRPEHPGVEALVERGYCYSGGLYYYRNIFTTDFYTQVQNLDVIYNLGGSVYYVVFSDIYYENGTASPEQSFAVIRKSKSMPYSIIRLGMGEKLLSEREIVSYTPQQTYQNPRWQTPMPDYVPSRGLNIYALAAIVAVSSIIFILGTIALIRELNQK